MDYFNYCQGLTMTNRRFHDLFGGPPRPPESPLEQRHMDLAASIQAVTEEVVLRIGRQLHRRTGMKNLVLAGGRGPELRGQRPAAPRGGFEDIWIQPAAGDAGGALGRPCSSGTSSWTGPASPEGRDAQQGSFLGPSIHDRGGRSGSWTGRGHTGRGSTTRPSCSSTSPGSWPRARSSAGSTAGWSSAPGPWAPGASWATPARPRCRPR